jgi:hypothetical protein
MEQSLTISERETMRNKSILVMPLLVAIVAGAVFAPRASARTSSASEVYWRCSSGFAFETSGSAVHCKKPQWTETKAFMGCSIGLILKIDLVGSTDMCAGNTVAGVVSLEPACYPSDVVVGFTKRRVDGKDYCGKLHPAEVIAPSQVISL